MEKLLDRIDRRINRSNPESEISRVYAAAGKEAVNVSQDTFDLVKTSVEYAQAAEGTFDPSIGSLVKLWRIGAGGQHPPADYLIEQAKSLVNDKDIELDEKNRTIAFLEQTPDVEGMFIMEDNKVYVTSGLHGKIKLTGS
ncbi:FAD:protein FMN transferase [uncultured Paenibacillus sp.]|uniref:FAD:protein FMN transferase n=1 Tax=uncultured Paenibacillus sp. TaxID=227322 RepID=UPI002806337D|nr:FAD:protein FMN transferase [uncultured Paenibacillus sp.]